MSPSPRRRSKAAATLAVLLALAAVVGLALVVGPRLSGRSTAASSDGAGAGAGSSGGGSSEGAGSLGGAAVTSPAPYTIKPEPKTVATDRPVPTTGGAVNVVMTYATYDQASGTVQANGFASGVIEDGGTCTLTLTRAGQQVTATTTGAADATTTSCGLVQSPAGLAPGTWDAVLTYSSPRAHGTSRSAEVTVR